VKRQYERLSARRVQQLRKARTLSIYLPPSKGGGALAERIKRLGVQRERSLNYLVLEAILAYLEREEQAERSA
jgi:hypothetical protein